MPPTEQAVMRLLQDLRLETPVVAVYDAAPSPEFEPLVRSVSFFADPDRLSALLTLSAFRWWKELLESRKKP
jgi:hypothetical protein